MIGDFKKCVFRQPMSREEIMEFQNQTIIQTLNTKSGKQEALCG